MEDNQESLGKIGMPGLFWKSILMEFKSYFFQLKNKNQQIQSSFFFQLKNTIFEMKMYVLLTGE